MRIKTVLGDIFCIINFVLCYFFAVWGMIEWDFELIVEHYNPLALLWLFSVAAVLIICIMRLLRLNPFKNKSFKNTGLVFFAVAGAFLPFIWAYTGFGCLSFRGTESSSHIAKVTFSYLYQDFCVFYLAYLGIRSYLRAIKQERQQNQRS